MAMKTYLLSLAALLCSFSTAWAQGPGPQDPPPRFNEQERRDRIARLESEIRDLEAVLKVDDMPEERRAEVKKRIDQKRMQLKALLAEGMGRPVDPLSRIRGLEMEIQETDRALRSKELGPEERKELTARLHRLRRELDEMRDIEARQDPGRGKLTHIDPPGPPQDPELHKLHMMAQELEQSSQQIAAKIRKLPPDASKERDELKKSLMESVTKLFDLREKARAREIEQIKKRLEELTQMLDKRKANRDAIIEKRVKQLSGEADDLDW
jgi:uncharacterized coiled-coil DUF342 family protein